MTGRVLDLAGRPLASADAFLLETLEGALTDLAGAFSFTTGATGPATLVVQFAGHVEVRHAVISPLDGPVPSHSSTPPVPCAAGRVDHRRIPAMRWAGVEPRRGER